MKAKYRVKVNKSFCEKNKDRKKGADKFTHEEKGGEYLLDVRMLNTFPELF